MFILKLSGKKNISSRGLELFAIIFLYLILQVVAQLGLLMEFILNGQMANIKIQTQINMLEKGNSTLSKGNSTEEKSNSTLRKGNSTLGKGNSTLRKVIVHFVSGYYGFHWWNYSPMFIQSDSTLDTNFG